MAFIKRLYGEYIFVTLVLALGVLASVGAAWSWQQSAVAKVRHEFDRAAQDRIQVIRNMAESNVVLLNALAAFHRTSGDLTRDGFAGVARQLLRDHPYLEAIEWAPIVKSKDREKHAATAAGWIPGFEVREAGSEGALAPAAEREEYAPLTFIEPFAGNEGLAGYDLLSDPDTASVLAAARDTRQVRASGLFTQWHKTEGHEGVLFAVPVYQERQAKDGREQVTYEALQGFVVSVISLPQMIEAALGLLQTAGVHIVITDQSAAGSEEKLLFVRSTRIKNFTLEQILEELNDASLLSRAETIEAGGRKWEAKMLAAPGFYGTGIRPETCAILAGGVAFTLLLVFYMASRIREHERISLEVAERTEEVARAKKRIELLLLSTREGILGLDAEGKITLANPSATALLGYSKRELIGKDFHDLIHHSSAAGKMLPREDSAITQALLDGRTTTVSDNVFWGKDGAMLEVEYTAAPVLEGDTVTGAVLTFRDVAERKRFEAQLEYMARHDQMTGLANRALFADRIRKAMLAADQSRKKVGVAYFDLNDFKPVNDTLGHAAGDQLLRSFAQKLQQAAGDRGVAARMGGDEFTLMTEGLESRDECLKIVDRLLDELKSPVDVAGQPFRITASIGIAFYPDDAQTPDALVKASDGAMYRAKQRKKDGGMKYAVYDAAQDEAAAREKKEARG